ncbi:hypothetical protein BABINDRAFT_81658 [Babjeviella inositovora NRRL Y-12698]|uniref:Uncharacterized protein n=1 Tax=Babjeviella inositovora NRRL Y-12698 TaxID=984486 RepID=A0A1E3QZP1_9ASCO|nr:uncharacterized protein BABINDRAFT_81658 [Babjeviella inositovora NRRL Y-12698]ODQ83159.1 hypothetical protein BABINDRAFT_81658 [Babjeviella inositovora NRRL Y-12698]
MWFTKHKFEARLTYPVGVIALEALLYLCLGKRLFLPTILMYKLSTPVSIIIQFKCPIYRAMLTLALTAILVQQTSANMVIDRVTQSLSFRLDQGSY